MALLRLIRILRQCLGEARWGNHGNTRNRYEIFRALLYLRFWVEIRRRQGEIRMKIFGFTITAPSCFELLYLFREVFIQRQYEAQLKSKDPLILDCGANIGMATLFFKICFPECRIICFEPNPVAFAYLRKNIEENRLAEVQLVNAALADKEGEMVLYTEPSNTLISSINRERGAKVEKQVPVVRLSGYLEGVVADLAKIDVEGAEHVILKDLLDTNMLQNVQQFIFEYHHLTSPHSKKFSNFLSLLDQHGFRYQVAASFVPEDHDQDIIVKARQI